MAANRTLRFITVCSILILLAALPCSVVAQAAQLNCDKLRTGLTPRCKCSGQVVDGRETNTPMLDCSNLGLTEVPRWQTSYTGEIAEFRLQNNAIRSLGDNSFSGLKVQSLDLSGNSINNVSDRAFSGLLEHLHTLVLEGDGLVDPPKNAFQDVRKCHSLTLRNYGVSYLDETGSHSFFLPFSDLLSLTLENWSKLTGIAPEAFKGVDRLQTLSLRNVGLTVIPFDTLRESHAQYIKTLEISNSKLDTVNHNSFEEMGSIETINLSHNVIGEIEERAFVGVTDTLKKIDLSHNVLTPEKTTGLKDLTALEELNLSGNKDLKSVPDLSPLSPSNNLKLLLSDCDITGIGENDFNRVGLRLQYLDLTQNKITQIHDNAFKETISLQTLKLSDQDISTSLKLPSSLTLATSLEELDLSGLQPGDLWSTVSEMVNLKVLNLASCQLNTIQGLAFSKLKMLKELNLENNRLSAVSQESFVGPQQTLRTLYLSGNAITTLPECLFYNYDLDRTPMKLSLGGNQVQCDCRLNWLLVAIQNGEITFKPGTETKCNLTGLSCGSSTGPQTCNDGYYTSSSTTTDPVNRTIIHVPRVEVTAIEKTSITISWARTTLSPALEYFKVKLTKPPSNVVFSRSPVGISVSSLTVPGLEPNTVYSYCVEAVYDIGSVLSTCGLSRTLPDGEDNTEKQTDDGEANVGIIVGAVVGAVVLVVLLIAIVYLAFVRRKTPKRDLRTTSATPVQPRTFTKAELPSMTPETRRFTKPQKPPRQSLGGGEERGMQVVAISDGMAGNGHVGRAHRMLSSNSNNSNNNNNSGDYKDMSGGGKSADSVDSSKPVTYENARGPLPPTPTSAELSPPPSYGAYFNEGFQPEQEYDKIHEREIVL